MFNKCPVCDASEILLREKARNDALSKELAAAKTLLDDILPLAMYASCMYRDHKGALFCDCCDWSRIADRISEMIGQRLAKPKLKATNEQTSLSRRIYYQLHGMNCLNSCDALAYSRWLLKKLIEWRTARAEYCDFDEWLKAQVTGNER